MINLSKYNSEIAIDYIIFFNVFLRSLHFIHITFISFSHSIKENWQHFEIIIWYVLQVLFINSVAYRIPLKGQDSFKTYNGIPNRRKCVSLSLGLSYGQLLSCRILSLSCTRFFIFFFGNIGC